MILRLTKTDGKNVYVNSEDISSFEEVNGVKPYTSIQMRAREDDYFTVKESAEGIYTELLKEDLKK